MLGVTKYIKVLDNISHTEEISIEKKRLLKLFCQYLCLEAKICVLDGVFSIGYLWHCFLGKLLIYSYKMNQPANI